MAPASSFLSALSFRHRKSKRRGNSEALSPSPSLTSTPLPQDSTSDDSITAATLWDKAYDNLKAEDGQLVDAYERVLSRELGPTSAEDNAIEKVDHGRRHAQMEQLVNLGMEKTGNKLKMEKTLQGAQALNNLIGPALQPVPQAALAWTAVSFALQIVVNPTTETRANREGVGYVAARMQWYGELSQLLLRENTVDRGLSSNLRSALEGRVVDLYELLLSFLMKSVCSYHRNRLVNYLQDTIKLNDWEGALKGIQDAEGMVQRDIDQYNTQQMRGHLETLVNVAQDQQVRLLSNIHDAVQDQLELKKDDADNQLLRQVCLTDPLDDMGRIEQSKDKLLEGSCRWILDREDFQDWRDATGKSLYWIKGEPGKGKTMLMIGIIRDMLPTAPSNALTSFFFCQNADPNLNSATAVLRGLIYQLASQSRPLIVYLRKAYKLRGNALFEDDNAFFAMSNILARMLNDQNCPKIYIFIDALDECEANLDLLLGFLTDRASPRLKVLVSSRSKPEIKTLLAVEPLHTELDLGVDTEKEVENVVAAYIDSEVEDLARRKRYRDELKAQVKEYLHCHADGTFLWVSLVCKTLRKTLLWKTLSVLQSFPSGLKGLYERMMEDVFDIGKASPETFQHCCQVLSVITVAQRPLHITELAIVADLPQELGEDVAYLEEIVDHCGSFLAIRDGIINFIHQSAKEFILPIQLEQRFPHSPVYTQSRIALRALDTMSATLHQDLWGLGDPVCEIAEIEPPQPDPLHHIRYFCEYWIDHVCNLDLHGQQEVGFHDNGAVYSFLRQHLLHWIEALSLWGILQVASSAMRKLQLALKEHSNNVDNLRLLIQDARHFLDYHNNVIWQTPLQVYSYALVFSPTSSVVRSLFQDQIPAWIRKAPVMNTYWQLHLHNIYGVTWEPSAIAFHPDGSLITGGHAAGTIEICNASTRTIERVVKGHKRHVGSLALSADGSLLASTAHNRYIQIWNVSDWSVVQTWRGRGYHKYYSMLQFSPDGKILLSAANGRTIFMWDVDTGAIQKTIGFAGHAVFLENTRIALAATSDSIRIWNPDTGVVQREWTLDVGQVRSLLALTDGKSIVVGGDTALQIWNAATGQLLRTLASHTSDHAITKMALFPGGDRLVTGSDNHEVQIWDMESGSREEKIFTAVQIKCLSVSSASDKVAIVVSNALQLWDTSIKISDAELARHTSKINLLEISPCRTWLVSGTEDGTIGIWSRATGALIREIKGHASTINSLLISSDGKFTISSSTDSTIRIWDTTTWTAVHVLADQEEAVKAEAFSPDGTRLLSMQEKATAPTVCIWNVATGQLEIRVESCRSPRWTWAKDGCLFACHLGNTDGTIEIWDIDTPKSQPWKSLKTGVSYTYGIAISHDAAYLAAEFDEDVRVYSLEAATTPPSVPISASETEPKDILKNELATPLITIEWHHDSSSYDYTRFSPDTATLTTSHGEYALDWSQDPPTAHLTTPRVERDDADGYGTWGFGITWGGTEVMKLPTACRSPHLALEDFIAVPHDGRVIMFELDKDAPPRYSTPTVTRKPRPELEPHPGGCHPM
ncbi:hypothetical protein BDW74DRAFT_175147 [Aspergillus multicolor]|uniref:uncharacterized protein n=1 Tax=Aspergillus multicolor TaxID=41759 RepID=UPI003CCE2B07